MAFALEWACGVCTFVNGADATTCNMCGERNPTVTSTTKAGGSGGGGAAAALLGAAVVADVWSCPVCTYINPPIVAACEICQSANPNPPPPRAAPSSRSSASLEETQAALLAARVVELFHTRPPPEVSSLVEVRTCFSATVPRDCVAEEGRVCAFVVWVCLCVGVGVGVSHTVLFSGEMPARVRVMVE